MHKASSYYLNRWASHNAFFEEEKIPETQLVVVIPSFRESELEAVLLSLAQCAAPQMKVAVLVVFNESESAEHGLKNFHAQQQIDSKKWINRLPQDWCQVRTIHVSLPAKKAGVGLARKTGMDEAIRWFEYQAVDGWILCLDADTLVEKNYFKAIESHIAAHPKTPAFSIQYAHRLVGISEKETAYILSYELHLRYFLAAKRSTGHPFVFETIGSAMGVRASAYCKQGGMNVRKAGEDFYFLNKFTSLPFFSEINSTKVLPSSRYSDRVPFGTGRAMLVMGEANMVWPTYDLKCFDWLHDFFSLLPEIFEKKTWQTNIEELLLAYLEKININEVLAGIRANTSSFESFEKRFYQWFDAFQIMKYLHFLNDHGVGKVPVQLASKELLKRGGEQSATDDLQSLVFRYRKLAEEY